MKPFIKNWNNPSAPDRLDLVFTNRNKTYGAYTIRSAYNQSLSKAFLLTCTGIVLLIALPALLRYFGPEPFPADHKDNEVSLRLTEVILPDQPLPIPEKKQEISQKPQGPTQQFNHLLVTDRDSVEKTLTQEELLALKLATKTEKKDSTELKLTDDEPDIKNTVGNSKVHTWVEEMPHFPGGEAAMLHYLASNISYPVPARENNLTGTVYISFIVDKTGAISNVKTIKGIGGGCEEEAIRAIEKMPAWRPGKQNGQAVNVQYMLPVSFKLK